MSKYKAAIFIFSFISSHALADPLGDFLGAVVAGAIQSSIQGAGSIRSAEQYCEAIESNQLIRTFATQLARYGAVRLSAENVNKIYEFQRLVMDNNKGQLTQWVYQRFGLRGPSDKCYGDCNERSKVVLRWAGACAAKHADDDLFLFFMHNLGTDRVEYERKKAKNEAEYSVYASAGGLDGHYLWVTLMAISLPDGISALETTGRKNVEEFRAYLDELQKEHERHDKLAAQKRHDELAAQKNAKKASPAKAPPSKPNFVAMSFDDFWLDKSSLLGKWIQTNGFSTYSGDMMYITKDFGAANMLYVETSSLQRQNRRHLLETCTPYCNVVVWGQVRMDMYGSILLLASRVQASKY